MELLEINVMLQYNNKSKKRKKNWQTDQNYKKIKQNKDRRKVKDEE